MIRTPGIVLALFTLLVLGGATIVSAGENRNFVAPLSGRAEVPAVDTNATGVAKFKLDRSGDTLHFKLNAANIDDVTQAHIHCGPEDANGPVVAFLYGLGPTVSPNGTLSDGAITAAEVITRPDSDVCPGGIENFDDLIDQMNAGNTYVNVHTVQNAAGEIRGQIK